MTDESTFFAAERRALITRRLAPFAIGWLGAMGIWLLVFAAEGRLASVAVIMVGAQAVVVVTALALCRAAPTAPRVGPVVVVMTVLLGLASTVLVDAVGAHGEILAFMLLTLYLAAALVFSWGWRSELALLLLTLFPWMLVLGRFAFFVPLGELGAAIAIGATLALAIAEGSARNVRAVLRRRRAEEEATRQLQRSRDAYRDIAEHARDMIWSADPEGRLTYVNAAQRSFLGLPSSEILGRSGGDFFTTNPLNPDFTATVTRILAGEKLAPLAIECVTPRGPRWIEMVSAVAYDQHGELEGFRGISRDIQERRDAEAALRQSEERFRSAFDHAAIGKLVVGMDGKAVEINHAFCEMLGYRTSDLEHVSVDTLGHPDDVAQVTMATMRLLQGEVRAFHMEKRYLHKDGHIVWCQLSVSLAHDAIGQPLHLIAEVQDISERKASADALRASEARYRELVESQHELIVRLDVEGRFTFVNDAYATKFGKSQRELLGQSFMDLVDPDDHELVAETIAAMAHPPHRALLEIRNRTVEGVRWIAWEGGVVMDATGRIVEAQAVGRDVTERRVSEDALRASEARYRGLVESAHESVTRHTIEGQLTFVNDEYCQVIGYRREDIIGRNPIFLVHTDDQAKTIAAFQSVLHPPHRCRIESRGLTPQGWRWGEWEVSGVRDGSDRVVEIQQVGRDVTARRQAEADLRESEARFRSAFEDAAIGMGVTTMEGMVVRANRAFSDMLGYAEQELPGRTLYDLVHPEDREGLRHDQRQLLQGGSRPYRTERRYLRVDGTVIWVVATASVVRDTDGKPLYVIGQLQDVTERRLTEEALCDSLAELRRSEEKLRRLAQRQVTIREEERKRLGFSLHDDVCQELVGVGILVASLRRKLPPMKVEHAAEFDRVVGYLGEVVEHLRLLARELRPLLLRDLGLDSSLRSLAEGMSTATLRVVTEFQTAIPRLDEEAEVSVYRIAQEALANVARHAGAGRIVITLAVTDGMLRLEVQDDGRGFDPAARPMAALGLASMEERALAIGGRVEIQSVPGRGTTVVLVCPHEVRGPGELRELATPSPTRSSSSPSIEETTPKTTPRSGA